VSRIFWDTNIFIYLIEDYGGLSTRVIELFDRMLDRHDQLYTSALTLGEILVKPSAAGRADLVESYESRITTIAQVIPFARETGRVYAGIRRDRTIRAPDAIQLACAAHAGIDLFITNDERLSGKTAPGIQFIASITRAFL
jgi:predicted nucleic acid-binding protein